MGEQLTGVTLFELGVFCVMASFLIRLWADPFSSGGGEK